MTDNPNPFALLFSLIFGPPPNSAVTGSQTAGVIVNPWVKNWLELAQRTQEEFLKATFAANTEAMITGLEGYKRQLENPWNPITNPFGEITKNIHRSWEKYYKDKGESPGGALYQQLKFLFSGSGVVPKALKLTFKELLQGEQAVRLAKALGDVIPGAGELYDPKYNHKFLTESDKGEIGEADINAIVKQFAGDDPNQEFPRIVITSSHAQGETLKDVTSITHGIESLIHHSQGEKTPISAMNGKATDLKKPIILYACDTQKNPFLNSVELMERLKELKTIKDTGMDDRFEKASPSACRIARLMLKCMVSEPEKINVSVAEPLKIPLTLKANAEHIAQHFQLIGYSKGGNVVSDAMRCLIDELTAINAQGQHLVQFAEVPELAQLSPDARIRNLVRNIACASFAAIEVPMADHYKNHGVRRFAVNNKYDQIANHKPYDSSPGDRCIKIEGSPEKFGHDPADALGTRDKKGYFLSDFKDPEGKKVPRRLKEWFAPMFGKAAISSISFEDDRLTGGNSILIGTAPGTPDELLMKYQKTIKTAMREAGLPGAELNAISNRNGRAFVLTFKENIATDKKALGKLQKAFEALKKPDVQGLVIAEEILEKTIPQKEKKMPSQEPSRRIVAMTTNRIIAKSPAEPPGTSRQAAAMTAGKKSKGDDRPR
jgi:hypothetical protein